MRQGKGGFEMARKKSLSDFKIDDLIQLSMDNACENNNVSNSQESESASDKNPVNFEKTKHKKKESFKKTLDRILATKVSEGTVPQAVFLTPLGKEISYQEAILLAIVIKASSGDMQAASFIRDSSGNKPKDEGEKERCVKFEDL
jgi:hypothetical protein